MPRPSLRCPVPTTLLAVLVGVSGLAIVVRSVPVTLDAQGRGGRQGGPATPAAPTLPDVDWRTYGGDLASARYSPLDQINAENFNSLQVAWRFKTDSLGPRSETNLEATPLLGHLLSVSKVQQRLRHSLH
jgi:glucose dehydrogenase